MGRRVGIDGSKDMVGVELKPSGKYLARTTIDGKRVSLGTYDTAKEAALVVRAALSSRDEKTGITLATFGEDWLSKRRTMASHASQVRVWRARIATSPFVKLEVSRVDRTHIKAWVASQTGSEQTKRNALNLLRQCFVAAIDAGHARSNPCDDIRVAKQRRTHEPWTYLTPSEVEALLSIATVDERDIMAFAIGTGLRAGELVSLERKDVSETAITVRYGGPKHKPTKSGKPRVVPLFGIAQAALKSWLSRHPEGELVFPSDQDRPRIPDRVLGRMVGGREGKRWVYLERFDVLCHQAGLFDMDPDRPLTWHSLRHTCASLLVSGAWGRQWTLREVQALLGHASITTTERYAHLCHDQLKQAAEAHRAATATATGQTSGFTKPLLSSSHPRDLNPRPAVYETLENTMKPREKPITVADGGKLARTVLESIATGDTNAWALAVLLAASHPTHPDSAVVFGGGPHAIPAATRLAAYVLNASAMSDPTQGCLVRTR